MTIRLEWPWTAARRAAERARDDALAAAADAQQAVAQCTELHRKALQCALAAGEAAGVVAHRGAGDGWRGGLDPDLETLDTH